MKRPGGGRQAERRTPPGRGALAPLNLIHTSNSPNPMPMRVTARFDWPEGVSIAQAVNDIEAVFGPLVLMAGNRGADATKSTI